MTKDLSPEMKEQCQRVSQRAADTVKELVLERFATPTQAQIRKAMILGYNMDYPDKWDMGIINKLIFIEDTEGAQEMIKELHILKGFIS